MSQELDIIEKEPNYVNPFKRDKNKVVVSLVLNNYISLRRRVFKWLIIFLKEDALDEKELLAEKDMKKKKKEKRPRGPGLSGGKKEL